MHQLFTTPAVFVLWEGKIYFSSAGPKLIASVVTREGLSRSKAGSSLHPGHTRPETQSGSTFLDPVLSRFSAEEQILHLSGDSGSQKVNYQSEQEESPAERDRWKDAVDARQTVMDTNRSVTVSAGSLWTNTRSTAASALLLSANTLQVEPKTTEPICRIRQEDRTCRIKIQGTKPAARQQNLKIKLRQQNLKIKTTRGQNQQNETIREQIQWRSRCRGRNQTSRQHHQTIYEQIN